MTDTPEPGDDDVFPTPGRRIDLNESVVSAAQPALPQSQQPVTTAQNVNAASQFAVSVSPIGVLLAVGQHRPLIAQDGNLAGVVSHNLATYSLSPGAAKELFIILESVIKRYERDLGPIVVSPEMVALQRESQNAQSSAGGAKATSA